MKLGLFGINMGQLVSPGAMIEVAQHAEASGFDSLWAGEHVVLPDPQVAPSPLPPDADLLDPAVALTCAAAATTRIRLATGIIILPQRNPVVLAKELASVDVLSGGRLIFGIGIGYLEPEFRAIGASFAHKGRRSREYLAAMRSLWEDEAPRFEGEYVRFSGVQQRPRPVQRPIPIVFGGHSAPAYRRALELAHGWYGFGLEPAEARAQIQALRAEAKSVNRPKELGRLEITVTPPRGMIPDRALADEYAEMGVDRLVPLVLTSKSAKVKQAIDLMADAILR